MLLKNNSLLTILIFLTIIIASYQLQQFDKQRQIRCLSQPQQNLRCPNQFYQDLCDKRFQSISQGVTVRLTKADPLYFYYKPKQMGQYGIGLQICSQYPLPPNETFNINFFQQIQSPQQKNTIQTIDIPHMELLSNQKCTLFSSAGPAKIQFKENCQIQLFGFFIQRVRRNGSKFQYLGQDVNYAQIMINFSTVSTDSVISFLGGVLFGFLAVIVCCCVGCLYGIYKIIKKRQAGKSGHQVYIQQMQTNPISSSQQY